MLNLLEGFAVAVLPVVFAITLHEAAHGYAALALGDDTARRAGRLSINPLRHIDRFGTLILPGMLILGQMLTLGRIAFMFGWAKPVPVSAHRFRHPRQYMALVAAAGPLANFVLAWLAALALHETTPDTAADDMLTLFMLSNLVLGLFNLLPIPPLDGGRIAVGVLPLAAARVWARLEGAGILIVLFGVFLLPRMLSSFGVEFDPVGSGLRTVLPWAADLVSHAAGWRE